MRSREHHISIICDNLRSYESNRLLRVAPIAPCYHSPRALGEEAAGLNIGVGMPWHACVPSRVTVGVVGGFYARGLVG